MPKFIIIASILLLFFACKEEVSIDNSVIYTEEDIFLERLEDVEMLYSDSARLQVRITAPTLHRYTETDARQEFPDGLLVEFFDANQNISGYLSAKYGIQSEGSYEVIVRDSVVWESYKGEKLETSELTWDERNGRIFTNKYVTLIREQEVIQGYGFEADQDFKKSRVRAVDGVFQVNEVF
ncbi:MAG: LPS export ABC transporter periplasmic protein LptC [Bacteroidota bacterium]